MTIIYTECDSNTKMIKAAIALKQVGCIAALRLRRLASDIESQTGLPSDVSHLEDLSHVHLGDTIQDIIAHRLDDCEQIKTHIRDAASQLDTAITEYAASLKPTHPTNS